MGGGMHFARGSVGNDTEKQGQEAEGARGKLK